MPKKTPEYRKERKHSDFLIPMREIIGRMVTLPTVKDESNEEEFDNTDDISVLITPQDFERLLLSELSNNYELEASDICSSVSKNQWNRLNFYGAHNFDKKVENSYQLARFPILHGIDESSIDKLLAESSEEFTPRSYEEDITKYI